MKIGVLAIQGNVREHKWHVERAGGEPIEVKKVDHLKDVDGLIIPGGESTTIGMLMNELGLIDRLRQMVQTEQFPIYGTCAGLILLAKDVVGLSPARLGLMDITADRNAFGRQVASFEARLAVPVIGPDAFPAVFIRAPRIVRRGEQVIPLATYNDEVILAESGSLLVSSFHPEMSPDIRIHQYFLEKVKQFRR